MRAVSRYDLKSSIGLLLEDISVMCTRRIWMFAMMHRGKRIKGVKNVISAQCVLLAVLRVVTPLWCVYKRWV